MSQGAQVALQARNFDGRVRAAWVMGGTHVDGKMSACVNQGPGRALGGDRVRMINGNADEFAPAGTGLAITGLGCEEGARSCFRENGSGWYLVQGDEVRDGTADHCYFTTNGGCTNTPDFDPGWAPPARGPWSLATNLDWLASFADR